MKTIIKFSVFLLILFFTLPALATDAPNTQEILLNQSAESAKPASEKPELVPALEKATEVAPDNKYADALKYTLGPDDIIEVAVMRHNEFSGIYPVNLEGKIQLKFAGDIDVSGLTKREVENKIKGIISAYVVNPEVNVTITEYRSKVIYVLGEVGNPGKFYMRSESIPVREAVVQAGLPTLAAAMRRCQLVTPTKDGKPQTRSVDLYSLLYGGNLNNNIDMHPGEVLYVPSTVMAKIIRVINPITSTVGLASSGTDGVSTTKRAVTTLK